jgi:hypothetical protein
LFLASLYLAFLINTSRHPGHPPVSSTRYSENGAYPKRVILKAVDLFSPQQPEESLKVSGFKMLSVILYSAASPIPSN